MQKIKFTAYIGASIDGIIAESGTSSNPWASREDEIFFQKALIGQDVFVVGSNTYRVAKKSLDKRNTLVFTSKVRSLKKVGSVTFINPENENVRKFFTKNKYKKVIILGGSRVYNYFLENKMLDELFMTIEPYIFTEGVRMFKGEKFKKYSFKLVNVKKLNKQGTLLLHYVH